MQWAKTKTILIILFVLVNVYLFWNYIGSTPGEIAVSEEVISDAVTILAERGITIEPTLIPSREDTVRLFDVTNKYATKDQIGEKLLGAGFFTETDQKQIYNGDNKVWINGSNFDFVKLTRVPAPISEKTKKDAKKTSQDFLKSMDFWCKYAEFSETEVREEDVVCRFVLKYDKKPVTDSTATIYIDNNGVYKFEARNWLGDTITDGKHIDPEPAARILIRFSALMEELEISNIRVTGLERVYYLGSRDGENKTITAVPALKIITDTGESYLFDARNGDYISK